MEKSTKIENIDAYIQQFDGETRVKLNLLRSIIKKIAPEAIEKISYQMPTFYLNGNLVHFAAAKNHIGFYPTPSAIAAFEAELKPYKTSKGAVQFPNNQPIPVDLVEKMVRFRLEEAMAKGDKTCRS